MNGVPLPEKHLNADEFEEVVLMEVMRTTQMLQKAVYRGELGDKHDVTDWLMAMPNIMPRWKDLTTHRKDESDINVWDSLSPMLLEKKEWKISDTA